MISPIFAYRTGQQWLGRVNMLTLLAFVVGFVSVHGFVLYDTWVVTAMSALFFINLLFAIITSSMFIHDRHPRASRLKIIGVVSEIFLASLLAHYTLALYDVWWKMMVGSTITTVTLYVTSVLLLRLNQLDRQPEI